MAWRWALTALSIRDIAGPHAPWAIMGLLVLLFLAVVWPTPFEYHVISKVLLRVNRLTGDVRMVFP